MPRPSLEPSEENKQNPGHQPARSVWGLKPVALRNRLPSCIGAYVNKATVNKNKNQAALMLWLSMCIATLSWPTALDAAAQKQISHVIRGGPLAETGRQIERVRSVYGWMKTGCNIWLLFINQRVNKHPQSPAFLSANSTVHSSSTVWIQREKFWRRRG